MKKVVYMPVNMYLDCRINKNFVIGHLIGNKVSEIIDNYGTNLSFKINKIKHTDYKDLVGINGYVRCHLYDEDKYFYTIKEVEEYLDKNWFDYEIEFEETL